ncbi:RNA pseudouridine synthase [Candidatus Gracilibacteria bacterium]|nr:MAG: RNA pseudouridine synthase [Candidatus Gracilibacteria bacterium]
MFFNFSVYSDKQRRVDIYLSDLFSDFSRSYIQKLISRGQVSVNGLVISNNIKIKNKDEIYIIIKLQALEILPEKIPLDIVYEDTNLLVINKESNINVHPVSGEGGKSGTLVNAVLYYLKDNLPSIGGFERPGIVHRLDKDTTGLIMIAKNDKMMNYLQDKIKKRQIGKYYIAIVAGIINDSQFKIESYIGRDPNNRIKMTVNNPVNPKIALTLGEVVKYIENKYTVLKLKIETGRTHQIRVHLSSIGFPVLGDKVYGNLKINKEVEKKYGLKRQALHASSLELDLYGKAKSFFAELKPDMKKIIK